LITSLLKKGLSENSEQRRGQTAQRLWSSGLNKKYLLLFFCFAVFLFFRILVGFMWSPGRIVSIWQFDVVFVLIAEFYGVGDFL
jgi:hypothetical protein